MDHDVAVGAGAAAATDEDFQNSPRSEDLKHMTSIEEIFELGKSVHSDSSSSYSSSPPQEPQQQTMRHGIGRSSSSSISSSSITSSSGTSSGTSSSSSSGKGKVVDGGSVARNPFSPLEEEEEEEDHSSDSSSLLSFSSSSSDDDDTDTTTSTATTAAGAEHHEEEEEEEEEENDDHDDDDDDDDDDDEVFYLEDDDLGNQLSLLEDGGSGTVTVYLCIYKINRNCEFPFLMYFFEKNNEEQELTIPSFTTAPATHDEIMHQALAKLNLVLVVDSSSSSLESSSYKGFLSEERSGVHVYLFFEVPEIRKTVVETVRAIIGGSSSGAGSGSDATEGSDDEKQYAWMIIDEILFHGHKWNIPINQHAVSLFRYNSFLCLLRNKSNQEILQPMLLFRCESQNTILFSSGPPTRAGGGGGKDADDDNDEGQEVFNFENAASINYFLLPYNVTVANAMRSSYITDPTFAFFFSTPLAKSTRSQDLKHYAVFAKAPKYILRLDKIDPQTNHHLQFDLDIGITAIHYIEENQAPLWILNQDDHFCEY